MDPLASLQKLKLTMLKGRKESINIDKYFKSKQPFGGLYYSKEKTPAGNVHWCVYHNEILGNIYVQNFKEIWRDILKKNFYGNKSCKFCLKCGGPCKLSAKYKNGDLYCNPV